MKEKTFLLVILFLVYGCSDVPDFDPKIPMEIPCGDCSMDVTQRDKSCGACDFLVSNSIKLFKEKQKQDLKKQKEIDSQIRRLEEEKLALLYLESQKADKLRIAKEKELAKEQEIRRQQEARYEEAKKLQETREIEKKIFLENQEESLKRRQAEKVRLEKRYWDNLKSVPRGFNIRLVPGSDDQTLFREIFKNYLRQNFAKDLHEFTEVELKDLQRKFISDIKNLANSITVKIKDSKIKCACSKGKRIIETSSLKREIVDCNRCAGTGHIIGVINYKLFYSEYKKGGIQ